MIWALAAALVAYPEGAPWGHAGAEGETCAACHYGEDAPSDRAYLVVDGLPDIVEPGVTYALSVRLTAPSSISGFQIAAAGPEGNAAGVFVSDGAAVEVDGAQARSTQTGPAWEVSWRAPEPVPAAVRFHIAATAGNDDLSPFGDIVFTRILEISAP